ncbi:ATP-grasp domain-containing protein [Aerococcus viridans]|uniref:ATP-grasp domain-containing protein n=1 Tax=Aerococcus viridans TaxID=1377 RepID=UPI00223C0237|nr:ATP-grasp domain-containing protein [Aerococcus viridans]MCT1797318.1 ATP-grasp domain-containing protein [Aerococcus viridans]
MNILILSVGTRNKIVQYFKKELNGKGRVFASDASLLAPALYEADEYFITPRVGEENYLNIILNFCKKNSINGILSLIDPELSVIARNASKFLEIGTIPLVSDYDIVEMSFNKFTFNNYLKNNNFNFIKSYIKLNDFKEALNKGEIDFPVFVKPVAGSASININKVHNLNEVELLFSQYDNLIIQEFMDGKEYGADVYIDLYSNKPVSLFIKEKLKMRAGETDKSVSIINNRLSNLIIDFVQKVGYKGVIDIDIFEVDGQFYISEVNPRFGGGYPHAYECEVNIPLNIINNLTGIKNNSKLDNYKPNVFMMKYSDLIVKEI